MRKHSHPLTALVAVIWHWRKAVMLVYLGVLLTLTHIPLPKMAAHLPGTDKHWHFLAYFPVGALLWIWPAAPVKWRTSLVATHLLVLAVFAAMDEYLQTFVNRHGDVTDWVADMLGGGSGLVLAALTATALSQILLNSYDSPSTIEPVGDVA